MYFIYCTKSWVFVSVYHIPASMNHSLVIIATGIQLQQYQLKIFQFEQFIFAAKVRALTFMIDLSYLFRIAIINVDLQLHHNSIGRHIHPAECVGHPVCLQTQKCAKSSELSSVLHASIFHIIFDSSFTINKSNSVYNCLLFL